MYNGDDMEQIIEKINIVLYELRESKYSYQEDENFEVEREKFFRLKNEIFGYFKDVYDNIHKNKLDINQTSRMKNTINLSEELEYYSDYSDPSPIEYVESLALFTEMANNMAHIIESEIKNNGLNKNKDLNRVKKLMYEMKTITLDKIARVGINRESEGIIVGTETDDYKSVNNKVLVLDLPRYGQLSWHYSGKMNMYEPKHLGKLPTYRYEIQKGVMDSRETSLNSKLLLGQGHVNDLNIHNKIDREIDRKSVV